MPYRESKPMICEVCNQETWSLCGPPCYVSWGNYQKLFPWRHKEKRKMCRICSGNNAYSMLNEAERCIDDLRKEVAKLKANKTFWDFFKIKK